MSSERGALMALAAPSVLLLLVAAVVLVGCDGGAALRSQVETDLGRVAAAVERLGADLDGDRVQNAALIKQYAARVARAKPELRELTEVLRREGTRNGTMYRSLGERLDEARGMLPPPDAAAEAYVPVARELQSLAAAADPAEFSRALSDPLNVLADLSDGALPRVDAISASASRQANGAADLGPGSQLVGNPHYGPMADRWRRQLVLGVVRTVRADAEPARWPARRLRGLGRTPGLQLLPRLWPRQLHVAVHAPATGARRLHGAAQVLLRGDARSAARTRVSARGRPPRWRGRSSRRRAAAPAPGRRRCGGSGAAASAVRAAGSNAEVRNVKMRASPAAPWIGRGKPWSIH